MEIIEVGVDPAFCMPVMAFISGFKGVDFCFVDLIGYLGWEGTVEIEVFHILEVVVDFDIFDLERHPHLIQPFNDLVFDRDIVNFELLGYERSCLDTSDYRAGHYLNSDSFIFEVFL